MKARRKLALERPTTKAKKAAARLEDGEARIVVNVPASLHRALKVRAAERGVTLKAYILELLEKEGLT